MRQNRVRYIFILTRFIDLTNLVQLLRSFIDRYLVQSIMDQVKFVKDSL